MIPIPGNNNIKMGKKPQEKVLFSTLLRGYLYRGAEVMFLSAAFSSCSFHCNRFFLFLFFLLMFFLLEILLPIVFSKQCSRNRSWRQEHRDSHTRAVERHDPKRNASETTPNGRSVFSAFICRGRETLDGYLTIQKVEGRSVKKRLNACEILGRFENVQALEFLLTSRSECSLQS